MTVRGFVDCGASHVVHFVPADPTVRARRDPAYRDLLNLGDLNVADGKAVVWALHARGHRTPRISGSRAMELLAADGLGRGTRHFLYGGAHEVLGALCTRLRERHPGIQIVGFETPPFAAVDELGLDAVAARVRSAGADLLWVGLGTPKQDLAAERLRALGCAPVVLCVGAAFDFVSGAKRRAPRWMQRSGLEWFHRLASEPVRLWRRYLIGNPRFVAGVFRDLAAARRGRG